MTWSKFHALFTSAGYLPVFVNEFHWQIFGGVRPVDVYLSKSGKTAFVWMQGMASRCNLDWPRLLETINSGSLPKPAHIQNRPKPGKMLNLKRELWNNDRRCYWCKTIVALHEATIDHVIPLSRGGTSNQDNLVLSCDPCNKARENFVINPDAIARHAIFAESAVSF